jgi:uncharacterized protein YcnI
MRRTLRNAFVVAAAVALGVLGFAGAADAHVTVDPDTATQGGYARIAFRVPTESDTASTTKLDVQLDTSHPVASVSTMPVPGWTAQTTTAQLATPLTDDDGNKITEAVSQITWTATSADTAIKPGQFQEFPVSLGPLPKTGKLVFKVLQTYSDGSVVRWIDEAAAGQAEPEHPAPVLNLTAASDDATPAATASTAAAAASSGDSTDTTALTVGIIGAVLGLVGLILGGLAFLRTRRPNPAE